MDRCAKPKVFVFVTTLFIQSELSNYGGRPALLYEFIRGDKKFYRYAAADRDITFGGDVYEAVQVSDGGVSQSGNAAKDIFDITIPADTAIVKLFRGTAPSDTIYIKVRRYHPGDADAIVYYAGFIVGASRTTPGMATIHCASIVSSLRRTGLSCGWVRECPYSVFDHNCRLDKANFATPGIVTAIAANVLTIPGARIKADGYFNGGFFEWIPEPHVTERRGISFHSGSEIVIFGGNDGLELGSSLTLYPGCARDQVTCDVKFGNYANYGGFIMMPGKSPYDLGEPIF